ncbi:hypothetical protein [Paractinoplanes atraurantiacus]|uniref:Uncharacterized protein n=1 Tax=Paractinoplanes atraurantiacus TaxID=1036182 RepID=A0A285HRK7_9ACTN|nr:hypothetical protein [Actinoplanes atraurantiacus]SNY38295.1 hypothetical protein SAMN05421748_105203 [Actinoplanes atraurantiacus]
MEPERGDGARTRIVHTLAGSAFYYDNPDFRARLGAWLGSDCLDAVSGPASPFVYG